MKLEYITSASNTKIRKLLELQGSSKVRRTDGLIVVEGLREIKRSLVSGFVLRSLFFSEEIMSLDRLESEIEIPVACGCFSISGELYEKVAYRGSTEGVIAEFYYKANKLDSLPVSENPFYVVVESVEKPGNLGAILRTCDGAGCVDAVIICDSLTDIYNPNVIRSSVGTVFTVPVIAAATDKTIAFLKERKVKIFTAQLQDSQVYYDCDFVGATAIVFGTEATGLSDKWRYAADSHILIPMNGIADSLNVSVSAAILVYEVLRQRR